MRSLCCRYLTGNQLSGESSIEGYIGALKRGCRCVECECAVIGPGFPIVDTKQFIFGREGFVLGLKGSWAWCVILYSEQSTPQSAVSH
jgi:hypothetical protein